MTVDEIGPLVRYIVGRIFEAFSKGLGWLGSVACNSYNVVNGLRMVMDAEWRGVLEIKQDG